MRAAEGNAEATLGQKLRAGLFIAVGGVTTAAGLQAGQLLLIFVLPVAAQLNVSETQILSAAAWSQFAHAAGLGFWIAYARRDRVPHWWTVALFLGLCAVGSGIAAGARGAGELRLAMALVGLGVSCTHVIGPKLSRRFTEPGDGSEPILKKGSLTGIFDTAVTGGQAVIALYAGFRGPGWRLPFVVLAVMLAAGAVVHLIRREPKGPIQTRPRRTVKKGDRIVPTRALRGQRRRGPTIHRLWRRPDMRRAFAASGGAFAAFGLFHGALAIYVARVDLGAQVFDGQLSQPLLVSLIGQAARVASLPFIIWWGRHAEIRPKRSAIRAASLLPIPFMIGGLTVLTESGGLRLAGLTAAAVILEVGGNGVNVAVKTALLRLPAATTCTLLAGAVRFGCSGGGQFIAARYPWEWICGLGLGLAAAGAHAIAARTRFDIAALGGGPTPEPRSFVAVIAPPSPPREAVVDEVAPGEDAAAAPVTLAAVVPPVTEPAPSTEPLPLGGAVTGGLTLPGTMRLRIDPMGRSRMRRTFELTITTNRDTWSGLVGEGDLLAFVANDYTVIARLALDWGLHMRAALWRERNLTWRSRAFPVPDTRGIKRGDFRFHGDAILTARTVGELPHIEVEFRGEALNEPYVVIVQQFAEERD